MTDTGQNFGAGITSPHRPRRLSDAVDGETAGRRLVEAPSERASFGAGDGERDPVVESGATFGPDADGRDVRSGRTSAFIVGEDGNEGLGSD